MKSTPKPPRLTSIDQFRGFAILLMVLANFKRKKWFFSL
jgi:uncharacterized membrane protein